MVKMAPILAALRSRGVQTALVHTGQHYDEAMSDSFFRQLGLPAPVAHFGVGSGKQGEQTAKILSAFESWLIDNRPAATLVVGDVTSTLACSLASVKLEIPVIHVEAGLRSFDRTMPEEINRIVTDAIAELLLVSEPSGIDNLQREGRGDAQIHLTGNVMIDALLAELPKARALGQPRTLGVTPGQYVVWTMHRPSNVDDDAMLARLCEALVNMAKQMPVVFPVHPRTRSRIEAAGLSLPGVVLTPPLGYLEFLGLTSEARVIVTDSGGLQEESTVLGIPCLTLRENTERPITVTEGTSTLVGRDVALLERSFADVVEGRYKVGRVPALWDGHAAVRIAEKTAQFITR